MGSATFTRVFSSGPLYGGCGPKGITCYGNRKMVAVFEETLAGVQGNPQRLIFSTDDGLTWAEGQPYYSQYNIWWYRAVSPATDRLLVGNAGPDKDTFGADAIVGRSINAGISWGGIDTGDFLQDPTVFQDYWRCEWIEACANNRVLSCGWFRHTNPVETFNLLISDDNGATFPRRVAMQAGEFDPVAISFGTYCGDGVIFLAGMNAVYDDQGYLPGRPIWRSTDNGETWTRQQLISTNFPTSEPYGGLTYVASLGGTKVLALASGYTDEGEYVPLLWISDDLGDTWEEYSQRILITGAWSTNLADWNYPQWAVGYGDGSRILVGIFRQAGLGECPAVIFSEDGGMTWQAATVPETETGETEVELGWGFVGKGDDGSLSATLYRTTDTGNHWDIYHGVTSWDMGAGPCGTAPEPPQPPTAFHFAHVPERDTYVPCPQECSLPYP